jgi:Icc-related predicted phosphoesterase
MMRQLLLCGGMDSNPHALKWLRAIVTRRHPDAILFVGDILDRLGQHTPSDEPRHLVRDDALLVGQFFRTVGELGVFSAIIPGLSDGPVEEFLRLGMNAEVEFPRLHLAHATLIEEADAAVCGIGGQITEGTAGPDRCSRTLAEYHLRSLWASRQPRKVLLLAAPPTGALGGPDGSVVVGELIDSFHPSLCVVNGPGERRGVATVAHTLIVNPGRLAEGCAAWVDWNARPDHQVELLNIRQIVQGEIPADLGIAD